MRDHAKEMKSADVVRIGRTDLPVQALGVGQPPGLMVPQRQRELLGLKSAISCAGN